MNFMDKMNLLNNIKEKKKDFEKIVKMNIESLAVNRLFFSDNETVPTIYLVVNDNAENIDIAVEKELMNVIDNVVFDVVSSDYYRTNISNTGQTI